jgi:hypothetical protein
MSKPKRFKWVVEIEVDEKWVAGGFDLTEERMMRMLQDGLCFSYSNETGAKILKAPSKKAIRIAQGYEI